MKDELYHTHYTYLGKLIVIFSGYKRKEKPKTPRTQYTIVKKDFHRDSRTVKVNKKIINEYFTNYSEDYSNLDASIQIGLQSEFNETERVIIKGNKTKALVSIKRSIGCECGCKDVAVDSFHGETFCPKCGLLLDKIMEV